MTFLIIHGIGGHAGIHWQQWLKTQLESRGQSVFMPEMPDADRPDREVWLTSAKDAARQIPYNELCIVAHSLGVATALDYIEQLDEPIAGLFSVSGFASDYGAELNSYFMKSKHIDFSTIRRNIQVAAVFYGSDDPFVTRQALDEIARELHVEARVIDKGGHLNTTTGFTEFPMLLETIDELVIV